MLFFESWYELLRVFCSAVIIYPLIILLLNIMGKRSTAKMNNFDWLVTVAVGSILGSAVLLKKVVLLEVMVGAGTLLILQYLFTKLSVRYQSFEKFIRSPAILVFYEGQYLEVAMRKQRLTRREVEAAIRKAGYADESAVMAVIFEPDGQLSVISCSAQPTGLVEKLNPDSTS